ncbi:hypothetical protein R69919_01058 [Paraburkholderia gardini]|nr:hypothetical protein R69919_01058 [Paraburkholderia gardini]
MNSRRPAGRYTGSIFPPGTNRDGASHRERGMNDEEYREALWTVSALVDLDLVPGSPDGDRLVALVRLMEQYEPRFMHEVESGKPAVR